MITLSRTRRPVSYLIAYDFRILPLHTSLLGLGKLPLQSMFEIITKSVMRLSYHAVCFSGQVGSCYIVATLEDVPRGLSTSSQIDEFRKVVVLEVLTLSWSIVLQRAS